MLDQPESQLEEDMARTDAKLGDQILPIRRLHLDSLNPRHEPLARDAEVIEQLCDKEFVAELAEDIATRGALSPLEVLGVIPFDGNPGHYIAVEGNRRVCALILLSDPSRAPSRDLQAQFQNLAARAEIPQEIKVHIFASRSDAKQWIDLRHLGSQGGVGTREWDATQKTRSATTGSARTSSRDNALALAVLDRLLQKGLLTPDQRKQVSLTTITRYLGTPAVRTIFGLGDRSELIYTHDPEEVDRALLRLVLDSITPASDGSFAVNSRSNSKGRVAYANAIKAQEAAPVTPLPSPAAPPSPGTSSRLSPETRSQSAKNPADLPTLFDSSFKVGTKDPVLLRLRKEARYLRLKDFPFSGNYLLRAFVEQTMILFAKKWGKYSTSMSDEKLTQVCAEELKSMGVTGKALTVVNKAASARDQPHSLHSLGHAVHGGTIPTQQSLRAVCDTWLPSLQAMLDAL
jgi:hypothetical protein